MSEGEVEVDAPQYPVLPKEVAAEIGVSKSDGFYNDYIELC